MIVVTDEVEGFGAESSRLYLLIWIWYSIGLTDRVLNRPLQSEVNTAKTP
ncbi:MAG: hypothetical protein KTR25_13605 [Myxococcales bacterium]|nr:hypothetical protein [Myxococcales bacterium]